MSWTTYSLADLVQKARLAFRAFLPGSDAWLWPNNIYVSAKVKGAIAKFGIDYADWIARQAFVHKADEVGIADHGAEFGIPRKPAAAASGSVVVTGATLTTVIADGATLTRSDNVAFVVAKGAAVGPGATATLNVTAAVTGAVTQTEPSTPLAPFSGVAGDATFAVDGNGLDGGLDLEDLESWRQRIWFRKRYTPAGGAPADWISWALEVPGVTRCYLERRWQGPGTLRLVPYLDDLRANGIPTTDDCTRIAQFLETKAPPCTFVVVAPSTVAIPVTIAGLDPNTTTMQAAVTAEIGSAFRRLGRPAGNDAPHPSLPFLMTPTSFSLSWLYAAISTAAGLNREQLRAPTGDTALSAGQAPIPGAISFV